MTDAEMMTTTTNQFVFFICTVLVPVAKLSSGYPPLDVLNPFTSVYFQRLIGLDLAT